MVPRLRGLFTGRGFHGLKFIEDIESPIFDCSRCVGIGVFVVATRETVKLLSVPILWIGVAADPAFLRRSRRIDFQDGFAVPGSLVLGKDENSSEDISQQSPVQPGFGGGSVGFETGTVF